MRPLLAFVLPCSLVLVIACASKSPATPDLAAACDDYFDATNGTRCGGTPKPDDFVAHARDQFRKTCTNIAALPGQSWNAQWLESCAKALQAMDCRLAGLPNECVQPPGSLPGGAPCSFDGQCASGTCNTAVRPVGQGDAGQVAFGCGSCAAPLDVGQPCNTTDNARCVSPGSTCIGGVCVATTPADEGQPCSPESSLQCEDGLQCGPDQTCIPVHTPSETCSDASQCASGFSCVGGVCEAPVQVGDPCSGRDEDCGPGLSCVSGPEGPYSCQRITWARPGEPCGSGNTQCLVGYCDSSSGTCSPVLPDGADCVDSTGNATCDVDEQCTGGTCQAPYATACP